MSIEPDAVPKTSATGGDRHTRGAHRASRYVRVAPLADVRRAGCLPVQIEGHSLVLCHHNEAVYALDNRCPHMGFPLHRGTIHDGVLTCHWHHARFDVSSGGTFDPWADDVRVYPVELRDGEIWVDLAAVADPLGHHRQRLRDGLERNISLVVAKAAVTLLDGGVDATEPFRIGLDFGVRHRQGGWGQGLTIHTCMMNLQPWLQPEDRMRALFHGLVASARDSANMPPRFMLQPLPDSAADLPTLKRWFRRFVEVRDAEGAERCLVSAVRAGAGDRQMADMLLAAATDHRYIDTGHVLDFTNKALEALDHAGWDLAEPVLASLAAGYAGAERMEESNAWRHPVDVVAILEHAFEALPTALEHGNAQGLPWAGRDALVPILLRESPQDIADGLLASLREGARPEDLAAAVAYAAALRLVRFHTSNEVGDWDTALHTFTFASAVHQGLRRAGSPEVLRGVFDAAMSVYLDRFLNVPPAPLPVAGGAAEHPEALLHELSRLLDRRQQVNEAGAIVSRYLSSGGAPEPLLARLGGLLLREDRDFHTIQAVEAAFRQFSVAGNTLEGWHVLMAAARYLAAHAPTMRAQEQTFHIARRLSRGERLYEDA
jgi:nitrite reductase/ring-hydroxylating ferredoxin subunit